MARGHSYCSVRKHIDERIPRVEKNGTAPNFPISMPICLLKHRRHLKSDHTSWDHSDRVPWSYICFEQKGKSIMSELPERLARPSSRSQTFATREAPGIRDEDRRSASELRGRPLIGPMRLLLSLSLRICRNSNEKDDSDAGLGISPGGFVPSFDGQPPPGRVIVRINGPRRETQARVSRTKTDARGSGHDAGIRGRIFEGNVCRWRRCAVEWNVGPGTDH